MLAHTCATAWRPLRLGRDDVCETIVIDNASADGSAEMVSIEFPEVVLVQSDVNLGFAAANNLGVQRAHGEVLALVNSDVVLHPNCLQILQAFLECHEDVGIVGPRIVGRDGQLQSSCRRLPTAGTTSAAPLRSIGFSRAPRCCQGTRCGTSITTSKPRPRYSAAACGLCEPKLPRSSVPWTSAFSSTWRTWTGADGSEAPAGGSSSSASNGNALRRRQLGQCAATLQPPVPPGKSDLLEEVPRHRRRRLLPIDCADAPRASLCCPLDQATARTRIFRCEPP